MDTREDNVRRYAKMNGYKLSDMQVEVTVDEFRNCDKYDYEELIITDILEDNYHREAVKSSKIIASSIYTATNGKTFTNLEEAEEYQAELNGDIEFDRMNADGFFKSVGLDYDTISHAEYVKVGNILNWYADRYSESPFEGLKFEFLFDRMSPSNDAYTNLTTEGLWFLPDTGWVWNYGKE